MEKKGIAIGVDDFLRLREEAAYYVDKSLLIKEVIDSKSAVTVFTRPRRFGKSLNMSMLGYYFDVLEEKTSWAFQGLAIAQTDLSHQNTFPVIKLTLKSVEAADFENALFKIKAIMAREYARHAYLRESPLFSASEKAQMTTILNREATQIELEQSLRDLTEYLSRYYGRKVMVLIDEYDVPLEKAFFAKTPYYEEMVLFMRGFYEALKTNEALYKAVLTGCLRVAKESIFTGLNNPDINSILSGKAAEYFGFTEPEVERMLSYYELSEKFSEAKSWYNGYEFGNETVYNPWSVINYVNDMNGNFPFPRAHWSNTSSNDIVRSLIHHATPKVKEEIEALLRGETLKKIVREEVVYGEITKNMDNLWSFLLLTGYLKKVSLAQSGEKIEVELGIPNRELKYIYDTQISDWFEEVVLQESNFEKLYEGVRLGDPKLMEEEMTRHMRSTISYLDHHENFHHGFAAGVLMGMPDYLTRSNRESGDGRADIFLEEISKGKRALILELKVAKSFAEMENACLEALKQIDEKGYEEQLVLDGYNQIEKYGVAFFKKRCKILRADDSKK